MSFLFPILSCLIALASSPATDGDDAARIAALLSGNRVSFDYSAISEGGNGAFKSKGKAVIQDRCFAVKGDGIEIYGDGSSRWTVDPKAKEVCIESITDAARTPFEDPEGFFAGIEDLRYDGNTITGTYVDPSDNSRIRCRISGIRAVPSDGDKSSFSFTVPEGNGWVVTDLR